MPDVWNTPIIPALSLCWGWHLTRMVNQNEITLAGFVVCSVKMPLPLLTRHFVEKKLSAYCQQKVPAHILPQVQLTFVVDGSTVTLIEARHTHAQP